ncbi:cell division protein ZapA [Sphingomonas bacterium]|uniref:cell division protein ZapA n=1 Tax=Sphingomonas bacterium TaxID=1895847 RepID=UPI001575C366|nr:cell division protein ZapA [Sphingomonas bacterium]
MAQVDLSLGGRAIAVACRDGEESRVRHLGERLIERWPAALRAAGGVSTERALFLLALMLADALDEAENRPPADGSLGAGAVTRLAERLEELADTLEHAPANA